MSMGGTGSRSGARTVGLVVLLVFAVATVAVTARFLFSGEPVWLPGAAAVAMLAGGILAVVSAFIVGVHRARIQGDRRLGRALAEGLRYVASAMLVGPSVQERLQSSAPEDPASDESEGVTRRRTGRRREER